MIIFVPNTVIKSADINLNYDELKTDVDNLWYMEIARTTLSVAGDTITVSDIPAYDYLKFIGSGIATGGTINSNIRFNNESTTNYSYMFTSNHGALTTGTSQTKYPAESNDTVSGGANYWELDLHNKADEEPIGMHRSVNNYSSVTASQAPTQLDLQIKFGIPTRVTRIDWINDTGTGDFAVGSEIIVFGRN